MVESVHIRESCYKCPKPRNYSCSCRNPAVLVCKDCRDFHESSTGNHVMTMFPPPCYRIEMSSKQDIINKLTTLKKEADEQILIIHNTIQTTINQSKPILDDLSSFKRLCDSYITKILSINEISIKEVYTPIEKMLLSSKITNTFKTIHAPKVKINLPSNIFSIIPSAFSHCLSNYCEFTSATLENRVKVHPLGRVISNNRFDKSSRHLLIDNNKLMFTGGWENLGRENFILNINTEEIKIIPGLNNYRKWHTMTWIDDSPAVIGGMGGNKNLNSVEIFRNDIWVRVAPITIPRCSASGIAISNTTWIVGGFDKTLMNSIEKYQNGTWTVFEVQLPFPNASIGLISLGENILMLGGGRSDNKKDDIFYLDTNKLTITEIATLAEANYFNSNQIYLNGEELSILGSDTTLSIVNLTQLWEGNRK
jgi:hypothetical protein